MTWAVLESERRVVQRQEPPSSQKREPPNNFDGLRTQYSIQNRKTSIRKLVTYLVNFQQDYFIKGPAHLKPLTQKDLAHHFKVNESTFSRAVKAKYLYTPAGMIELKDLFMESLGNDQTTTKNVIYAYIEELISTEDKLKPLSDNKITLKISEKGIAISRRTIAKYREELGIANKTKNFLLASKQKHQTSNIV